MQTETITKTMTIRANTVTERPIMRLKLQWGEERNMEGGRWKEERRKVR